MPSKRDRQVEVVLGWLADKPIGYEFRRQDAPQLFTRTILAQSLNELVERGILTSQKRRETLNDAFGQPSSRDWRFFQYATQISKD